MTKTISAGQTSSEALRWATEQLAGQVERPRVDAEILLRCVLACSRSDLYAHSSRLLGRAERHRFQALVLRRRESEPLQYLTGTQAFRHLEILVGPGVLVPRPETEIVVERVLQLLRSVEAPLVLDLGTGSGAIALSIASERPDARVWGADISSDALRWTRLNLERLRLGNVTLLEGDLFEPIPEDLKGEFHLVICNPPYLSLEEFESAPQDIRSHEPRIGTLSGPTGLETSTRVIEQAVNWLRPGAWLVLEIAPQRAGEIRQLLSRGYDAVGIHRDLARRERIAEGKRRGP